MPANHPALCALPIAARQALEQALAGEAALRLAVDARLLATEARLLTSEQRVKILEAELRLLRVQKFGPKSEALNDAQLALLDLEPSVTTGEVAAEGAGVLPEKAPSTRRHPGRTELPAHLPRIGKIIVCTPAQCLCTQCGQERRVIGYDECEELDRKPLEYFVSVIRREKRACPRCEEAGVATAPVPLKIIEKGKASDRIVVDVLVGKYADHLPLYRQEAIFERDCGVRFSRQTLCGWVMQAGGFLEAVSRAMRADLLGGTYIQADETPVGVQGPGTQGHNHSGYLWEYSRPGGTVVFDFRMNRKRAGPVAFLGSFAGVLQSDGYVAYRNLGGPGLVFAGCWAHARRGFADTLKTCRGDPAATEMLGLIARLYAVESRARAQGASAEERLAMRQAHSVPLLAVIKDRLVALRQAALPAGGVGKACDYALGQWERLTVYAGNGEVEIDNNWCENAIRPLALGRRNWLSIGSEEAGPRVAAIASVFETCRRLGINVREYLLSVLPRLPTWPAARVGELTPAAWLASQPAR